MYHNTVHSYSASVDLIFLIKGFLNNPGALQSKGRNNKEQS